MYVQDLLEHVCILYTGGLRCGCWKQVKLSVTQRWQSSESLRWMMCVVELLGRQFAKLFHDIDCSVLICVIKIIANVQYSVGVWVGLLYAGRTSVLFIN